MNFILGNLQVILIIIIAIGTIIGTERQVIKRKNRGPALPNTSVLFSYYSEGASLTKVTEAKLSNGLVYRALLAENKHKTPGNPAFSIIYIVQLPFSTKIHLLGIPKKTNATLLNPAQNNGTMEKVSLEGNYDQIFQLYTEKGMQTKARYVLDPKAMVFTIDFCQSQNWEIVGNELYFVVASDMKTDPNDVTGILEDVVLFIEEIKPAVARPLSPKELKAITPYGQDHRTDLLCPLCKKTMLNKSIFFECPDGHGVLLGGGMLSKLVGGEIKLNLEKSNNLKHEDKLICPSCNSLMTKTNYANKDMLIDSCTNCSYRWLDAGELTK